MDPDQHKERVELANLRLQVSALTEKLNTGSLAEQLQAMRKAVLLASFAIGIALIISAVIVMASGPSTADITRRLDRLEQRIGIKS